MFNLSVPEVAGEFLALSNSWILEGLDAAFQKLLLDEMELLALPGGQVLLEEGHPPDAMYVVTSGILGVGASRFGAPLANRGTPGVG